MLKTCWKCIANEFEHFNFKIGSFYFFFEDSNLKFRIEKFIISKFKFLISIILEFETVEKI